MLRSRNTAKKINSLDAFLSLVKSEKHNRVIDNSRLRVEKIMNENPPTIDQGSDNEKRKMRTLSLGEISDVDPLMQVVDLVNRNKAWDIDSLLQYMHLIKEGLQHAQRRPVSLSALQLIVQLDIIAKLSAILQETPSMSKGIRQKQIKAKKCAEELRELCNQKDVYASTMSSKEKAEFEQLVDNIKTV